MKIAVVRFPGSNCDEDALYVFSSILSSSASLVWHKESALPPGTDLVVLPGGFSYGDALRSGALARFSPIMQAVKTHAAKGGFVLGICNGFQILLEAGMLPGAMLQNASRTFVCREVTIRNESKASPFSCKIGKGSVLRMPVAHHEGRYYADQQTLEMLRKEDRVLFRYVDDNPNGSADDIAGILNVERNVLGMMPHPERAAEGLLGGDSGLAIFQSIKESIEQAGEGVRQ